MKRDSCPRLRHGAGPQSKKGSSEADCWDGGIGSSSTVVAEKAGRKLEVKLLQRWDFLNNIGPYNYEQRHWNVGMVV